MNKLLSVILPVYNREQYISRCIDSILEQTFENFELIILNDGSTDNTEEIIKSKKDSRIVYVENKLNQGLIRTLNRGLYLSKGEYIGRMDSDDICLPNRFKTQISYMLENKDTDILGANMISFTDDPKLDIIADQSISVMRSGQHKVRLLQYNTLSHPTVIFRKNRLLANKLYYDKNALHVEDYKLWIDALLSNLNIESLKIPLLCYRLHNGQISRKNGPAQFFTFNSIRYLYALHYFSDLIQSNPALYLSFI